MPHWDIWRTRSKAQDISARISLHEFIHVEATKIGWEKDQLDNGRGFTTLLWRLEEAGKRGLLQFWGIGASDARVPDCDALVPIPAQYWVRHGIDKLSAIYELRSNTWSYGPLESYCDLHLSRGEALEWLDKHCQPTQSPILLMSIALQRRLKNAINFIVR